MPTTSRNPSIATLDKIPPLQFKWREGQFTDAEYATVYFLYWQLHKHGSRFASRASREYSKPSIESLLSALDTLAQPQRREFLAQYLQRHHFLGVIPAVSATLANWLQGHWQLRLCDYIPSSVQVLAMQVEGTRPVTVIADYPRMLRPVLTKNDAFEFMLHDLEHAYKFFHDTKSHHEQRALFALLQCAMDQGLFEPYAAQPEFADKLAYLLSDMNTHAAHALQYLRAMFVDYYLRRDGKEWHEALSAQASHELRAWVDRLAQAGEFSPGERQCLLAFFEGHYDDALALRLLDLLRDYATRGRSANSANRDLPPLAGSAAVAVPDRPIFKRFS